VSKDKGIINIHRSRGFEFTLSQAWETLVGGALRLAMLVFPIRPVERSLDRSA
jgi:hypothetical protein